MASLRRDQIKAYVETALNLVADFDGEIENYEFKNFHEYHKRVFMIKLKELINSGPYYDRNGLADYSRYYDISLSYGVFGTWKTVSDCINYVFENLCVKMKNLNKIKLS